jgi:Domain of unknown function (DUF397)
MEGTDHALTTWRKSTYSGSNGSDCVEVGTWRKSTYSGGNGSDCVEVGGSAPVVLVRDTKDRAGAVLTFGPDAWRRFAAAIKSTDRA